MWLPWIGTGMGMLRYFEPELGWLARDVARASERVQQWERERAKSARPVTRLGDDLMAPKINLERVKKWPDARGYRETVVRKVRVMTWDDLKREIDGVLGMLGRDSNVKLLELRVPPSKFKGKRLLTVVLSKGGVRVTLARRGGGGNGGRKKRAG